MHDQNTHSQHASYTLFLIDNQFVDIMSDDTKAQCVLSHYKSWYLMHFLFAQLNKTKQNKQTKKQTQKHDG